MSFNWGGLVLCAFTAAVWFAAGYMVGRRSR